MEAVAAVPLPRRKGVGIGWTASVIFLLALIVLASPPELTRSSSWGLIVVAPLLIVASIPILRRQAIQDGDNRFFYFLLFALILKLAGALVRRWVAVDLYAERADVLGYDASGLAVSEELRAGHFFVSIGTPEGFLGAVTGVVYTIIGTSLIGGYLFFSWLGFWGLLMMYRAFRIALPDGRGRTYARMLFLLPSLVFWPSSIGKEAFMMFALGLAAYGVARILSGGILRGLPFLGFGLWLATVVRPHIAFIAGLSLVFGAVVGRIRKRQRKLPLVVRVLTLVIVGGIGGVLLIKTGVFLEKSNVHTEEGLSHALDTVAARTTAGKSQFEAPVLTSPARAPLAIVTVLYRPFPVEARSAQILGASLETTFLLFYTIWRWRWVLGAFKGVRRMPYLAFSFAYIALSIAALSTFSNFGILARQRTLLLPIFLVVLSIPPVSRARRETGGPRLA